jgi:hypothetical protein
MSLRIISITTKPQDNGIYNNSERMQTDWSRLPWQYQFECRVNEKQKAEPQYTMQYTLLRQIPAGITFAVIVHLNAA